MTSKPNYAGMIINERLYGAGLLARFDHAQSNQGSQNMSKKTLPAHEVGGGNIFADLGLPNAEEHQLKAALVVQLGRLIKK
jgi:hypothetical protein